MALSLELTQGRDASKESAQRSCVQPNLQVQSLRRPQGLRVYPQCGQNHVLMASHQKLFSWVFFSCTDEIYDTCHPCSTTACEVKFPFLINTVFLSKYNRGILHSLSLHGSVIKSWGWGAERFMTISQGNSQNSLLYHPFKPQLVLP